MKRLPTGRSEMRYYKYPHHSAILVSSALWMLFAVLVLIGGIEIAKEGFIVVAILQAGITMLLRLIDAGEIVRDARGGWRGV